MNPSIAFNYLLNEISLELFENSFFDINGKKQDRLTHLNKPVPVAVLKESLKENELLRNVGFSVDSINSEAFCKIYLRDCYNNVLETNGWDLNKNYKYYKNEQETEGIETDFDDEDDLTIFIKDKLALFESDKKKKVTEETEDQIREVYEFRKIKACFDSERDGSVGSKKNVVDKNYAAEYHYEKERQQLLKQNVDVLRLINHILLDQENIDTKSELMRYVISSKKMLSQSFGIPEVDPKQNK